MPAHEPHAITRLRERFGIELTVGQIKRLAKVLSEPDFRRQDSRFRLLARYPDGNEALYVNLERYAGKPLWATAIYNPKDRFILTFLPPMGKKGDRKRKRKAESASSPVETLT